MKWFLSLTRCHFQPRVTVAGNGTECEVKTFEFCSRTSGGEHEYLFIDTGVKKMKWFLPFHEVSFPATSDRRSRVAGNGTECEVKSIELSPSTSGGEQ